jgi:hypothetical protein
MEDKGHSQKIKNSVNKTNSKSIKQEGKVSNITSRRNSKDIKTTKSYISPKKLPNLRKLQSQNSGDIQFMKNVENRINENKEGVQGLSFEPLILECKKLIVLMRNICARKGILLLEKIQNVDKDGLGVISTNKLGFLLETLVGLNGKQIRTLLGFFDSFQFGYVNIKDFCICLRDERLLKEVALKIGNKMDKIKMEGTH